MPREPCQAPRSFREAGGKRRDARLIAHPPSQRDLGRDRARSDGNRKSDDTPEDASARARLLEFSTLHLRAPRFRRGRLSAFGFDRGSSSEPEVHRRQAIPGRMSTSPLGPALDEAEDCPAGFDLLRQAVTIDQLALARARGGCTLLVVARTADDARAARASCGKSR